MLSIEMKKHGSAFQIDMIQSEYVTLWCKGSSCEDFVPIHKREFLQLLVVPFFNEPFWTVEVDKTINSRSVHESCSVVNLYT